MRNNDFNGHQTLPVSWYDCGWNPRVLIRRTFGAAVRKPPVPATQDLFCLTLLRLGVVPDAQRQPFRHVFLPVLGHYFPTTL